MEILCAFIFLGLFSEISSMQNLNLSAILNILCLMRACDKSVGYKMSRVIKTSVM